MFHYTNESVMELPGGDRDRHELRATHRVRRPLDQEHQRNRAGQDPEPFGCREPLTCMLRYPALQLQLIPPQADPH